MEQEGRLHAHPVSGAEIFGFRLEPGDVLFESDVYDSTSGRWGTVPLPGVTIQPGSTAYFVRKY